MAYGYQIAGRAARFDADFIPSLIGILAGNTTAGPMDIYYVRVEYPEWDFDFTAVNKTGWVNYDSTDTPIMAVKGSDHNYYMPLDELIAEATAAGDHAMLEAIRAITSPRVF